MNQPKQNTKTGGKTEEFINKIFQENCLEFMKKLPDKSVDLVLTDPPYGIGEHGGNKNRYGMASKIKGFKAPKNYPKSNWDSKIPSKEYFDQIFRVSKNQVIFGMNYFSLPSTSCFVFWHKKGTNKTSFADGELIYTSFKSSAKYFKYDWIGFGYLNNPDKEKKQHPTQKPQALMRYLLNQFSKEGDIILDPFAGSGSTCVASKELKRNFIGIEISPEYCRIAEDRLRQEK